MIGLDIYFSVQNIDTRAEKIVGSPDVIYDANFFSYEIGNSLIGPLFKS